MPSINCANTPPSSASSVELPQIRENNYREECAIPPPAILTEPGLSVEGPLAGGATVSNRRTQTDRVEANRNPDVDEIKRAINRKRFYVIAGIGFTCVLITASAMKLAGCTYDEIQWPITIEVMIFSTFLAPTFANSIA